MITLDSNNKEVKIDDFRINDPKLYSFLEDKDPAELDKWLEKILIIGAVGLEQISLVQNMDFIEKRFDSFLSDAKESFNTQQEVINKKLDLYFNEENTTSMISKFKKFIENNQAEFNSEDQNSLLGKFKQSLMDERIEMNKNFDKIFSLNNTESIMYKFKEILDKNKDDFDLNNPNSLLGEFKNFLESESKNINEILDNTFSEEKQDGVLGKFKNFLKDHENKFDFKNTESVFSKFAEYMKSEKESMNKLFDENFSMEKTNSSFYKLQNYIKNTFDMESEKSPLNEFKTLIKDYFDSEDGKLQKVMNDYIGEDNSRLQKLLDKSFDLENKNSSFSKLIEEIKAKSKLSEDEIKELLNPNKTDSPIALLKNDISKEVKLVSEKIKEVRENEIKEIRDKVITKQIIDDLESKGTQKGDKFEETVYDFLEELCSINEDTIHRTGYEVSGSGKVGDIICDFDGDAKKRVVIECKDKQNQSAIGTHKEIMQAIENRNAKFGIFLFERAELMPKKFTKFGSIKITDSYIITSYDKENLYLSYRLAKIFLSRKESGENVKSDMILSELKRIETDLDLINQIQAKASNVINSGNYIKENLAILRNSVESGLKRIESGLF